MQYRTAELDDVDRLLKLYRDVAAIPGGIVRLESEITDAYISTFIRRSIENGLIIVGEHPSESDSLVASVHGYKSELKASEHILTDVTLVVHPDFRAKKIGRTLFTIFLEEIGRNRLEIGKVELIVRESNTAAIQLYQSLGFKVEGRMEMRIKTTEDTYEAAIPMGWQNPNYEF